MREESQEKQMVLDGSKNGVQSYCEPNQSPAGHSTSSAHPSGKERVQQEHMENQVLSSSDESREGTNQVQMLVESCAIDDVLKSFEEMTVLDFFKELKRLKNTHVDEIIEK